MHCSRSLASTAPQPRPRIGTAGGIQSTPSKTTDLSAMLSAAWAPKPDVLIVGGYTADMMLLARRASEQRAPENVRLPAWATAGFVSRSGPPPRYARAGPVGRAHAVEGPVVRHDVHRICRNGSEEFGYEPDYHPPQSTAALRSIISLSESRLARSGRSATRSPRPTSRRPMVDPFNEKGRNIAKGMGVIRSRTGARRSVPHRLQEAELVYPMPQH